MQHNKVQLVTQVAHATQLLNYLSLTWWKVSFVIYYAYTLWLSHSHILVSQDSVWIIQDILVKLWFYA